MSWLTRGTSNVSGLTTWTTGQVPTATEFNAAGLDLRTWGGNVDAGGNNLTNLGQIVPTGNLGIGIGITTPGYPITVSKTAAGVITVLAIQNLYGTGSGNGAGLVFRANDSVGATVYSAGRIYGQFDSGAFTAGRLTIQTVTGNDTFADCATFKNARVGIGIADPVRVLQVKSASNLTLGVGSGPTVTGSIAIEAINDAAGANIPLEIRTSFCCFAAGNVGIGMSTAPTAPLQVIGIPVYANNAAAITGGLSAGAFYRTGANPDPLCIVH